MVIQLLSQFPKIAPSKMTWLRGSLVLRWIELSVSRILVDFQQLLGPPDLFRRGRDSVGQGIGDAELLPFEEAQRVVGQAPPPAAPS